MLDLKITSDTKLNILLVFSVMYECIQYLEVLYYGCVETILKYHM